MILFGVNVFRYLFIADIGGNIVGLDTRDICIYIWFSVCPERISFGMVLLDEIKKYFW